MLLDELVNDPVAMRKMDFMGIERGCLKSDRWSATFVGTIRGKVVGFVKVKAYADPPRVAIAEIFVIKKYRRKGYAEKLIRRALEFSEKTWISLYVYALTIENPESEALLQKLGFRNAGTYEGFVFRDGVSYNQTLWKLDKFSLGKI